MHRFNISRALFKITTAELSDIERHPGGIEIVTGHHQDHGFTILVRQGESAVALVENISRLQDGLPWEGAATTTEAALLSHDGS